jgi:hypothetical protein
LLRQPVFGLPIELSPSMHASVQLHCTGMACNTCINKMAGFDTKKPISSVLDPGSSCHSSSFFDLPFLEPAWIIEHVSWRCGERFVALTMRSLQQPRDEVKTKANNLDYREDPGRTDLL